MIVRALNYVRGGGLVHCSLLLWFFHCSIKFYEAKLLNYYVGLHYPTYYTATNQVPKYVGMNYWYEFTLTYFILYLYIRNVNWFYPKASAKKKM